MNIPTLTIEMYAGDTSPDVELTCTRRDGSVVDLTGAVADFEIQARKSDAIVNTGHTRCFITDESGGVCHYSWRDGDLPLPGLYDAYLRLVFADNQRETYRLIIHAAART